MGHPRLQASPPFLLHNPLASGEWTNYHDGRFKLLTLHTESFLEPQSWHFLLCLSLFSKSKASAGFGSGGGKKDKELLEAIQASHLPPVHATLQKPGPGSWVGREPLPAGRPPAVLSGVGARCASGAVGPGPSLHVALWVLPTLLWPVARKTQPSQCLLSANLRLMAHLENRLMTPTALEYGRWVWEQDHCKREPYLVAAQLWNSGVGLALET